jgi:TonB family protein
MSQRNLNSTGVCHWLIHHAARHAPQSFAERLEEEWLADLEERSGAVSRLGFAIGCCWATRVIAREHQPAAVAVTNPVIEGRIMMGYPDDFGFFSRRSSTLFWVVALHAVVFYSLMTTVLHVPKVNHDPLQNLPVKVAHPVEPPQIPKPQLQEVGIIARLPDLNIPREPDPKIDVTTVPEPKPPGPSTHVSPPHIFQQVPGGPGTGFPDPDDFYPTLARHLEEQGVATVQVCVDANGRLTSAPTTLQGTGSARLDEGALKLARAGSGHYRATTQDGHAMNSCFPFRVRFQLRN